VDERQLARVEAIVLSMTPHERRIPHVIDGSRRKRIAAGSGTTVEQVNGLLEARKQMAKMMKQLGKGKMPALPGQPQGQNVPGRSATKKKKSKRKKSKSRR
jgi:signal recognition particle subunit SRP54